MRPVPRRSRVGAEAAQTLLVAVSLVSAVASAVSAAAPPHPSTGAVAGPQHPSIRTFFQATSTDDVVAEAALEEIAAAWRDSYTALIIDLASLLRPSRYGHASDFAGIVEPPQARTRRRLIRFLEEQTGQELRDDLHRWRRWMWRLPYDPHPDYLELKRDLYGLIDERMRRFFPDGAASEVRLDEIVWGGVRVNGIPPLDHPEVLAAGEADYLDDGNVVFGVVLGGEARAYPKRILAWHELARDRLGGVELTIVYCTLCGTVIPYDSIVGDELRKLGTSGLLYRSNKLMFDEETNSLWSTITGTPVVGELVGAGLHLEHYPVVTTTWREWRDLHPDTTVLSLETGHERDYSEGAAYRDYFATDRLMFEVPEIDERLKNKAEVLALRLAPRDGAEPVPLAIAADFLLDHPVYEIDHAGRRLVVVTSPEGANRVYERGAARFGPRPRAGTIEDDRGRRWRITEEALVLQDDPSTRLPRVPAHRAFWFGWYAQFPETALIR